MVAEFLIFLIPSNTNNEKMEIQEHRNLYAFPVTCVVVCPVKCHVVIDIKCCYIICLYGHCNSGKL